MELICCVQLMDSLVRHYLEPLLLHPLVSRVWVVRTHRCGSYEMPKVEYRLVPLGPKPLRWVRMTDLCHQLGGRKDVRGVVSFNPIPYGLIAASAAWRHGKAVHFGFIGSDWYQFAGRSWAGSLRSILGRADFVTATGGRMRKEMIASGFKAAQTAVLPHCVDLDRFTVADPQTAEYDFVYVGSLIHRKRLDLILEAMAALRKTHQSARLCIVGGGPLEGPLKARTSALGLENGVDFVGLQSDVRPYLARARAVLIASDREGFPFALVEGMACGLVPVSTPVGTIPDLIEDGVNGLLFPQGNAEALAGCLRRLLDEPGLYDRMRAAVLNLRPNFSYEYAAKVWDPWLRSL